LGATREVPCSTLVWGRSRACLAYRSQSYYKLSTCCPCSLSRSSITRSLVLPSLTRSLAPSQPPPTRPPPLHQVAVSPQDNTGLRYVPPPPLPVRCYFNMTWVHRMSRRCHLSYILLRSHLPRSANHSAVDSLQIGAQNEHIGARFECRGCTPAAGACLLPSSSSPRARFAAQHRQNRTRSATRKRDHRDKKKRNKKITPQYKKYYAARTLQYNIVHRSVHTRRSTNRFPHCQCH
jgi:hypothetical protein